MIRNKGRAKPDDSYGTDEWILNMLDHHYYDPCPLNGNFDPEIHVNGLETNWFIESYSCYHRVFVNPPYSNPMPWVEKALEEWETGCRVYMLLKHDSSTKWYAKLHAAGAKFLMIQGRLKHRTGSSASFPSVLVVLD